MPVVIPAGSGTPGAKRRPEVQLVRSAAIVAVLVLAQPVFAQAPETRAEALRQQRAEKAQSLTPYKPSGLESAMTVAEDRAIAEDLKKGIVRARKDPQNNINRAPEE